MNIVEALQVPDWLNAMHEELHNFKRNQVLTLLEKPEAEDNIICTKWLFQNKQDEDGPVVCNRAHLVS